MREILVILVSLVCIWGLFVLEREPGEQSSKTLWLPLIWCLINGSRPVSVWLGSSLSSDPSRYAEGTPLDAGIYGVMILAGLLILNRRASQVWKFVQSNPHILLYFAYCALSISWSDFPYVAAKRWVKLAGDVVMLLVVCTDANRFWAIRRLFSRVAFVLLTLSVAFILFLPDMGRTYDPGTGITYFNGVTTQKNILGETCVVTGLASLWLLLTAFEAPRSLHRRRQLLVYGVMVLLAAWMIVKADAMTSLMAFVLAGAVMILLAQRWLITNRQSVHVLVGSAVGLSLFALFLDAAGALLQLLGRTSSFTGRTDIWRGVLAANTNPLIGTGYESFWLGSRLQFVWDVTGQTVVQAHNGYLEIYINLGWIGVLFLVAMILFGYKNAVLTFQRDQITGRLSLAFLAASLIYSFSEAGFRMLTLIWFAFLFAISGITIHDSAAGAATPDRKSILGNIKVIS
jgi:O-antigen ligase